jgi:hypothetical protein
MANFKKILLIRQDSNPQPRFRDSCALLHVVKHRIDNPEGYPQNTIIGEIVFFLSCVFSYYENTSRRGGKKTTYWLLILVLAMAFVAMPGCKKKKSDLRITEVWGSGYYVGPGLHGDSKLEFRVKVENQSEVNAIIKEFLLEIRAGDDVVIQASKTGSADFQSQITPHPAGVYPVAANDDFSFSLLYFDHTQDIYNGKNPGMIKVSLNIEDDNGNSYVIEGSAAFDFIRY